MSRPFFVYSRSLFPVLGSAFVFRFGSGSLFGFRLPVLEPNPEPEPEL